MNQASDPQAWINIRLIGVFVKNADDLASLPQIPIHDVENGTRNLYLWFKWSPAGHILRNVEKDLPMGYRKCVNSREWNKKVWVFAYVYFFS